MGQAIHYADVTELIPVLAIINLAHFPQYLLQSGDFSGDRTIGRIDFVQIRL